MRERHSYSPRRLVVVYRLYRYEQLLQAGLWVQRQVRVHTCLDHEQHGHHHLAELHTHRRRILQERGGDFGLRSARPRRQLGLLLQQVQL